MRFPGPFLGALFVGDSVFVPLERAKERDFIPKLRSPLDLRRYLELRHRFDSREA